MKQYPLRKDIEKVDVCECGHINGDHSFRTIEMFMLWNNDFTGECTVCTCPKYKKEYSMLKADYLDRRNSREVKE